MKLTTEKKPDLMMTTINPHGEHRYIATIRHCDLRELLVRGQNMISVIIDEMHDGLLYLKTIKAGLIIANHKNHMLFPNWKPVLVDNDYSYADINDAEWDLLLNYLADPIYTGLYLSADGYFFLEFSILEDDGAIMQYATRGLSIEKFLREHP